MADSFLKDLLSGKVCGAGGKPLLETPPSLIGVFGFKSLLLFPFSFLLLYILDATSNIVQVLGSLPPTWKTWMELLDRVSSSWCQPHSVLAFVVIWGVNQHNAILFQLANTFLSIQWLFHCLCFS